MLLLFPILGYGFEALVVKVADGDSITVLTDQKKLLCDNYT